MMKHLYKIIFHLLLLISISCSLHAQSQTSNFSNDTIYLRERLNYCWQSISEQKDFNPNILYNVLNKAYTINWEVGVGDAYNSIGVYYQQNAVADSAYKNLIQAITIRKKLGLQKKLASSYDNLGMVFRDNEIMDSAYHYLFKALNLRIETGDDEGLSKSYNSLGVLYDLQGEYDSAIAYFSRNIDFYKHNGSQLQLGKTYNNLAAAYQNKNDCKNSYAFSKLAIEIAQQEDFGDLLTQTLPNYALAQLCRGETNAAFNSITQAIKLDLANEDNYELCDDYLTYAEMLVQISDSKNAINTLNNVLTITDTIDYISARIAALKALSELYKKNNNYALALKTTEEIAFLEDSLNAHIRETSIAIQKVVLQTESVIKENKKNKEEKISDRRKIRGLIIAISTIIVITVILLLQQRRISRKQSQLQSKQIKTLLSDQELKSINTMLEVQETERKRIAEDLHDGVGSILSTVKMYFTSLNDKMDDYQQENREQYDKANVLLDKAVEEVRQISHNLVSGILMKFGLAPALRDLCATIDGTGQLKTSLSIFGLDDRIENTIEIAVYRIIQELLSNTMKHSKASEVTISLTRLNNHLNIMVEDNGKGFDTQAINSGIGLKNIRSRVEKLSGKINFDSVIGRGTIVIVEIPV